MFKWLRQLLAGEQSAAIPEDAIVERDAQGRVVRVQQTLSATSPGAQTTQLPRLDIAESSKPALAEASQWLCRQNIEAACNLGIGLENNFSFDQGDGLLRLFFDQLPPLLLPSQLLGSFTPGDRSFMWGWHNPSFQPDLRMAAEKAREAGRQLGEAAFDCPVQRVTFEQLKPLLAFAAQASGCDGVYRAILDDNTSVFIGFRIPEDAPRLAAADAAFARLALACAESYDREQLAQDAFYQAQKQRGDEDNDDDDDDLLHRVIAAKRESWQQHWARDDNDWQPCSVSWPSSHERSLSPIQFIAPHPVGGVLACRIGPSMRQTIYHLRPVGDQARIVDQLLDWGEGFIWPGVD